MKSHNFVIVNGDTDSISFKKRNEAPFTPEEQEALLAEINSLLPEHIVFKNDKHFRRVIVFKAKNYVLDDGKSVKIKGSALKASKKEPALRDFIKEVIELLLKDKKEQVLFHYIQKVQEIHNLKDISPWCFKATVTKKVLDPATAFNKKILDAIGEMPVSEGDKVYLFFKEDGTLCLRENFKGDFDRNKLLGKLRDTMDVFANVFDVELFPDFTLKRNKELFNQLFPVPKVHATFPPVITSELITRAQ